MSRLSFLASNFSVTPLSIAVLSMGVILSYCLYFQYLALFPVISCLLLSPFVFFISLSCSLLLFSPFLFRPSPPPVFSMNVFCLFFFCSYCISRNLMLCHSSLLVLFLLLSIFFSLFSCLSYYFLLLRISFPYFSFPNTFIFLTAPQVFRHICSFRLLVPSHFTFPLILLFTSVNHNIH